VSKNCFLSWLQLAEVTMIRARGQLKRHHRAAATRTVDVLPAPLQAVNAVGWPASMCARWFAARGKDEFQERTG
jgi:hypothetical protein